jgi:hypothetical protein
MFHSHVVRQAVSQTLTTLVFGSTCLAVSAIILASAPSADAPPRKLEHRDIVRPKSDSRLAAADDWSL